MTDCCTAVGYLRRVICQSIWSGRHGLVRIGALALASKRNHFESAFSCRFGVTARTS